MPRPVKRRRVCSLPRYEQFAPAGSADSSGEQIIMSVDEYETIRLIDLEDLTQEACAEQMGIARTSVQASYQLARKKLAEALVEGRPLLIRGGRYELAEHRGRGCGRGCRHGRRRCAAPTEQKG